MLTENERMQLFEDIDSATVAARQRGIAFSEQDSEFFHRMACDILCSPEERTALLDELSAMSAQNEDGSWPYVPGTKEYEKIPIARTILQRIEDLQSIFYRINRAGITLSSRGAALLDCLLGNDVNYVDALAYLRKKSDKEDDASLKAIYGYLKDILDMAVKIEWSLQNNKQLSQDTIVVFNRVARGEMDVMAAIDTLSKKQYKVQRHQAYQESQMVEINDYKQVMDAVKTAAKEFRKREEDFAFENFVDIPGAAEYRQLPIYESLQKALWAMQRESDAIKVDIFSALADLVDRNSSAPKVLELIDEKIAQIKSRNQEA